MAEPSEYLYATNSDSYGTINNSQENASVEGNPIKVLIKEIKSGRQRLGPVVLYSLIAVLGASLNGFMLGFTSVLEINMRKRAYTVEEGQMMQYIGVRNDLAYVQPIIIFFFNIVYCYDWCFVSRDCNWIYV